MVRTQTIQQSKGITINKKTIAYAALIFVVFVWGTSPLLTRTLYRFYTPSIYSALFSLTSAIALLIICAPHLKKLNSFYFKLAIPTGIFNSLASLMQKIGLQYTTPTKYAFLENLSCIVVPVLLFFFIKKKPSVPTIMASVLCLASSFILSGMSIGGASALGKGEILCALAGLFYGVNIAATGAFAKKLYAPLYVMIQIWVQAIMSFCTAFALNAIKINGAPIEQIKFVWDVKLLLCIASIGLICSTFCWIIRTNAMKHIDASVVAVIMPFSAVITGVLSVITGADTLSYNLVLGGAVGLCAAILSGLSDKINEQVKKLKLVPVNHNFYTYLKDKLERFYNINLAK